MTSIEKFFSLSTLLEKSWLQTRSLLFTGEDHLQWKHYGLIIFGAFHRKSHFCNYWLILGGTICPKSSQISPLATEVGILQRLKNPLLVKVLSFPCRLGLTHQVLPWLIPLKMTLTIHSLLCCCIGNFQLWDLVSLWWSIPQQS